MNRKVTYANLHKALFIPGIGELGSTLPPINKTVPGLEMYINENDLVIRARGVEAFVPRPNVAVVTVAPEEPKSATVKPITKSA